MTRRLPTLSVRVLGPLLVQRGDSEVRLRPAQRRVLAIVYLHPDRALDRDELIDRMWGDAPPRTARTSLQVHISAIRAADPSLISHASHGYRAGVSVDDRALAADLARDAEAASAAQDWSRVIDVGARGLALWRGMPFAELAADPWAAPEIHRLEELRWQLVDLRARALLATGGHATLVGLARIEIARDPLRETNWQHLMLALLGERRPVEAIRAYEEARRVMGEELGIEPGPALSGLAERIRYGDTEDGEPGRDTIPNNLPIPGTSFVGRETDLAAVESLLRGGRVVTIVGGPGIGKTRLAIEVGRSVLDGYPDGVWFVSLAPARSERDVTSAILTASRTEYPSIGLEDLARVLARRHALLILDNCEHVLDPAAAFLRATLALDGDLHVVATSRRGIGLDGASTWSVGTLTVPAVTDGSDRARPDALASSAMRLFIDRARAADRSFRLQADTIDVVAEVCRSTAGIPLAVELAAGWLPAIPVSDLARVFGPELGWRDDAAAELVPHASLAAAIDRSTDLLPRHDRRLLRSLTVFAGTFSLSDAHAVCAPTESIRDVAAGIARLVDASLVVVDRRPGGRAVYRTLVPIREHLRGEAATAADGAARAAFVDHYLGRAEAWCPDPLALGTDFAAMDDDIDNVRAALSLGLEDGRADDVARATCALAGYFYDRYLSYEGREWLVRASDGVSDPGTRVQVLRMLGAFAQHTDDHEEAARHLARAARLARALGDPYALATCLPSMAQVFLDRGRPAAGLRAAERAVRLLGPDASAAGRAVATYYVGEAMACRGRVRESLPLLLDAARLWRESDQLHRASYALSSLAMYAALAGLEAPARRYAPVALQLARSGGSDYRLMRALRAAATVEAAWGDPATSARLFAEHHAHLGPSELGYAVEFLLPTGFLLRRIGREDWLVPMLREAEAACQRFGIRLSVPWVEVIHAWRRDAERRDVIAADLGLTQPASTIELAARTLAVLKGSARTA